MGKEEKSEKRQFEHEEDLDKSVPHLKKQIHKESHHEHRVVDDGKAN